MSNADIQREPAAAGTFDIKLDELKIINRESDKEDKVAS
jgi:hypothetical protein